jgi:hypothetical protein
MVLLVMVAGAGVGVGTINDSVFETGVTILPMEETKEDMGLAEMLRKGEAAAVAGNVNM